MFFWIHGSSRRSSTSLMMRANSNYLKKDNNELIEQPIGDKEQDV